MKPTRKLILSAFLTIGAAASALAQGGVVFENGLSTGSITIGPNTGPASYAAAGTYTVSLLWAPGTEAVPQNELTQIALYGEATSGITLAGFFLDGHEVFTGNATSNGMAATFEVQGWLGAYASYADAVAAGVPVGQTSEFINGTADSTVRPPVQPIDLTGWDGNLVLVVPEPGTLAIAALGGAGIWFFRRRQNRKNSDERT